MDLNELVPAPSSKKIAQVANKIFGYAIDVDGLTENKAKKLHSKVSKTLTIVEGREGSKAFDNKQYQELRLAKQALDARLAESAVDEADVDEDNAFNTAAANAAKAGKSHFTFNGKKYPVKMDKKTAKDVTEGRMGFSDLAKLGMDNAALVDIEARRQGSADMEPGKADELRYKIAKKMGLVESVQINEGEVESAELVLAAKDMVDRIQGMLEDVGKMINEDLPPLTDAIRDEMDSSTADSFNSSMSTAMQGLLDNLGTARTGADDAARILVGDAPSEPMGMEEPGEVEAPDDMEMGADMDMDSDDDFAASDAAVGGDEPAGREKA